MTQAELVLDYIRKHGSITPMEAFSYLGVTKLATVVSDLRRHGGVEFIKTPVKRINRQGKRVTFMQYSLEADHG